MTDLNELSGAEIYAQVRPEALEAIRVFTEHGITYTDLLAQGREMLEIDPLSASVMFLTIIEFFNPEDEDEEELSYPPEYNDVMRCFGVSQVKMGAHEYAIEPFDTLCGLEPENPDHHFFYAVSLLETGYYKEAEDAISKIPALEPDAALCLAVSKAYYGRRAELLKDDPATAAKATAAAVQYAQQVLRFSEPEPQVWDAAVLWLQEINPQKPANPAPSGPPGP